MAKRDRGCAKEPGRTRRSMFVIGMEGKLDASKLEKEGFDTCLGLGALSVRCNFL